MKKIIWTWSDDYGYCIDPVDSLEEILEIVIDNYFADYQEFSIQAEVGSK